MGYKSEFIRKNKEIFRNDLLEKQSKTAAHQLIENYFNSIREALKNEVEVAGNDLKFVCNKNSWKIEFKRSWLAVYFKQDQITVELMPGYEDVLNYDKNKFYSYRYKEELSEELLDKYLEEVFSSKLNYLTEESYKN